MSTRRLFTFAFFKRLITVFLFSTSLFGQEGITYEAGKLLFKVYTVFEVVDNSGPITQTEQTWFNELAGTYNIYKLDPIFQTPEGDMDLYYKIRFDTQFSVEEVKNTFLSQSEVDTAWVNYIGESFGQDEFYDQQWALENIQAYDAWQIESGESSVILAILDTGIDLGNNPADPASHHPDLVGHLWNDNGLYGINLIVPNSPPNDEEGHGTHVAGIAAAATWNDIGVAGLAGGGFNGENGIQIMVVKTYMYEESLSDAIQQAVISGANIINISGGFYMQFECHPDFPPEFPPSLEAAVQNAYNHNVLISAAIGNAGNLSDDCPPGDLTYKVSFPAYLDHVVSVANVDINDSKYGSSAYANWCDISAPGANIISTWLRSEIPSGYTSASGTSMSSPMVAGFAGLIKSRAPDVDTNMIQSIIFTTADDITEANQGQPWENRLGAGRINAYNSLNLIEAPPAKPLNLRLFGRIDENPTLTWSSNTEADLKGYYVYRKLGSGGNWMNISGLITDNSYTDYELVIRKFGDTYYYIVKAVDIIDNLSVASNTASARGYLQKSAIASSDDNVPTEFYLSSNCPNPFNPITTIRYDLPEPSYVSVVIYDILGREVRTLLDNREDAGFKSVVWNGKDNSGKLASAGIYIYMLRAWSRESEKTYHKTKKMVLLR